MALAREKGHACDVVVEYDDYGFVKETLKKLKLFSGNAKEKRNILR